MDIITAIAAYGAWAWIVAGLIMLGLELLLPGGILLWLGVAGIVTGLASLFQPIAWPVQWLIFGLLSLVTITLWMRFYKSEAEETDRPLLNLPAAQYFGRETVLKEAISDGIGRIAIDDSVWRVTGPELDAGRRVRIVGNDGALLKVEAI